MQAKALIYCRVSSDRQVNEGHGLDSQEKRCRNYAKDKDYKVEAVFPDEGISGGLFERPAMKRLIEFLDAHPTENYAIIFDDPSRFARDVKVHLQLKAELVGRGARLESPNFNFEDTPEGELIENVTAATSQYDRQKNRRQVIQKQKARLEAGYWAFCTPPGLKNFKDTQRGKILKPDGSPKASVRKAAIEKFITGELKIQDDVKIFVDTELRKMGVKSNMSHHGIQSLLQNPLNYGLIAYPKWGIPLGPGKHDGLVNSDLYPLMMARFSNKPKIGLRKDYSDDFPCRGLIRCSVCGGPFTGSWNTGRRGKKYPHYACKVLGCPMRWKSVGQEKLHDGLLKLMEGVSPSGEIVNLTTEIMSDVWSQKKNTHEVELIQRQAQAGNVESEIENIKAKLFKAHDRELEEFYEQELKGCLTKKKELEEKRPEYHYSEEEFGTASKLVFQTLEQPVDMWQNPEGYNKRAIVLMYFEDKLRYNRETGFGTTTLASPLALMKELSEQKVPDVEMRGVSPCVKIQLLNFYKRS